MKAFCKKIYKNGMIILFIAFISANLISLCARIGADVLIDYLYGENSGNIVGSVVNKSTNLLTKKESFELYKFPQNEFITVNGLFQKTIGNDYVYDSETGLDVVKLKNNYLTIANVKPMTEEETKKYNNQIKKFAKYINKKQTPFLYVQIPDKTTRDGSEFPTGVKNYSNEYFDSMISLYKNNNLDVLDLRESMVEDNLDYYSLFFKTDHHWLPSTGLWAARKVSGVLADDYGFDIDLSLLDSENYLNTTYKKLSLGSWGKRVGPLYDGVDDFTLITPNFDTSLSYKYFTGYDSQGGATEYSQNGKFEDALIEKDYLTKNYFSISTYATYLGGDFGFSQITNNNIINGKKILVLKNSYANTVLPFMALADCSEMYIIDPRHNGRTIESYVEKFNPDIVIFMINTNYEDMKLTENE